MINAEDEMPNYSKENLKKFYKDSFDPTTGWDRKNKVGFESGDKKTFFRISKNGYRGDNRFKKTAVSVFGDPFAFCRYVNDDETWESYLEDEIKMNINNYGVGNFGLDQSYLKFRKYKKNIKSKIIIFNIVPETIARINSIGNTTESLEIFWVSSQFMNLKKTN